MRIAVHVHHHLVLGAGVDKALAAIAAMEKETEAMGEKTNAAVARLVTETTDAKGKLASLNTAISHFPAVVAAAVADALAKANVDDTTAAAAIDQATGDIQGAVDQVITASEQNPTDTEQPGDTSGASAGDVGSGDTGSEAGDAGSGGDTSGTGSVGGDASGGDAGSSQSGSDVGGSDAGGDVSSGDAGTGDAGSDQSAGGESSGSDAAGGDVSGSDTGSPSPAVEDEF